MRNLITIIILLPYLMSGMDKPAAEREQETERIVDEISALRKPKEKKTVLELLNMPQQELEMDFLLFLKLQKVCSYEHVPLMKALLDKGTIKANCYYLACGYKQTLFTTALEHARRDGELGMVRLFLEKGANPSVKSLLRSDEAELNARRGFDYDKTHYMTPLHRIAGSSQENDRLLMYLLMQHGADLNTLEYGSSCFMLIVNNYTGNLQGQVPTDQSNKRYQLIRECLSRGAQINIPSKCTRGVLTPLQFARAVQSTELVALFEEHQKKVSNA